MVMEAIEIHPIERVETGRTTHEAADQERKQNQSYISQIRSSADVTPLPDIVLLLVIYFSFINKDYQTIRIALCGALSYAQYTEAGRKLALAPRLHDHTEKHMQLLSSLIILIKFSATMIAVAQDGIQNNASSSLYFVGFLADIFQRIKQLHTEYNDAKYAHIAQITFAVLLSTTFLLNLIIKNLDENADVTEDQKTLGYIMITGLFVKAINAAYGDVYNQEKYNYQTNDEASLRTYITDKAKTIQTAIINQCNACSDFFRRRLGLTEEPADQAPTIRHSTISSV